MAQTQKANLAAPSVDTTVQGGTGHPPLPALFLHEGERLDDLQRDGYRIIQNEKLFCFGMDAVLLSSFAQIRPGEKVLDLCSGNGVIPILLRAKSEAGELTGLEINPVNVDMAQRSARLNGISGSVHFIEGDVRRAQELFPAASFDAVTCNPPYMTGGHGLVGAENAKAIARHEILCTLEDVVRQSARLLKVNGRLYMVHRPFRLAEILVCLVKYKLEPKRLRLVYPFVDREPSMVLIEARLGGKPRVTVEKPLIIYQSHEGSGVYTDEVRALYNMQTEAEHGR